MKIPLYEIAHARSGDKGSGATLGIIAYTAKGYELLAQQLTADFVERYFNPMGCVGVKRYEVPKLGVLNFVLPEVLAGGGSRSLRIDAQGKAVGQVALEMLIEVPESMLSACKRMEG